MLMSSLPAAAMSPAIARPTRAIAWPRIAAWAALFTAIGVLNALHFYLSRTEAPSPWLLKLLFVEELTGAWSAGLAMPLVVGAARRILALPSRTAQAASHVAALLAFSAAHTTLIWASRHLACPLVGLGPSLYGWTFYRASMEFPSDVIVYVLFVCGTWFVDHFRISRARELRASQLESALAEARLEALRLQLNPHFLFNALNAVSETMYDRPRVADEILARIGELLRATLSASAQEHTLADELRLLGLYVAIQRARFGEQLQVDTDIAPGLDALRVPFLVLQPLVENAIEHGGEAFGRRIAIRAVAESDRVELVVRDHGTGAGVHAGHGIGLANLRARLAHLHGDGAGLALEPMGDGGMQVRLWLPLRTSPAGRTAARA
jgi:two-component system, LytTR family, sensor kinase